MLYYGLVSTAIAEDRQQLREGMRLLAEMAHQYNIPITWAIVADSAQFLAKDLTEWHNKFGDEPLLMLDIKPLWETNWAKLTGQSVPDPNAESEPIDTSMIGVSPEVIAEHLVIMRETASRYISTERKKMARALEWTTPNVAGTVWKNHVLVHALEQVGFRGLWGYRWDERGSVAEVDRGSPFGFFYPSAEQHNFSAPAAGSIAGIPYSTAAHLDNNADNNLRASLINNAIPRNYDLYVQNQKWNRWLSYVQHINALEVAQLGQETLKRLDTYFAQVASSENTKLLPLSEMVDDYWTNCQQTEPTFVVATKENVEAVESESTQSADVGTSTDQKAEKVFFYYDSKCQLTFSEGTMEPIDMKNYISPPVLENLGSEISHQGASVHGVEYHLPKIANFRSHRKRSRLHVTFAIESTKVMPYGVAIWGDHLGLQLANSNAEVVTWVDKHLLFIRVTLEPGNNDFEIILTI